MGTETIHLRTAPESGVAVRLAGVGAQQGLVELTDRAIDDVYGARDFVEGEVERLAVPCLGEDALADLRAAISIQQRAVAERDSAAMIAGNRAFHFAIFERCPNPWLVQFVAELWDVIDPYRVVSYGRMWSAEAQDELKADEILVEHTRILNALSRGGDERALHLLRRHRDRSQSFVETLAGPLPGATASPR
jgi:DNA-binding GntR family transcriptional regulator